MDKRTLVNLVSAVTEVKSDAETYHFSPAQEATLLVGVEGTLLSIERISKLRVLDHFVVAVAGKGERYALDTDCILGLKLHDAEEDIRVGFNR